MSLTMAVLAGGLATRLRPMTDRIPKVLVEVAGEPFAVHQIALLRSRGIEDLVFLVGHLGELVRDRLGDGRRYGVRIRYVFDGPTPRGTGGAVLAALPALGDPFLVMYGDSYLDCDYAAVARACLSGTRAALMTVYRNDDRFDRSNVWFEEGRILRYDKHHRVSEMRHIDYGLGAFRARAFDGCPQGRAFDLADLYRDLAAAGDLDGYEVRSRFYEIGSPDGLRETRALLESRGGRRT